jgi:hypothetical protein
MLVWPVVSNAQDTPARGRLAALFVATRGVDSLPADPKMNVPAQDSKAPKDRRIDSLTRIRMADSVKKAVIVDALLKNPNLRPAMISTTFIGRGQLEGNFRGQNILSGNFVQRRTDALLNLPVKNWGKNGMVTATVYYVRTNYELSDIKGAEVKDANPSKNTVGLTTTYRRIDSLFGRMFISSARLILMTGDGGGVNKYTVMVNGMFLLKKTATTTFMLGAQVIYDPTVNMPVVPLMVYQKNLPNGFDLNITIPQQLTLRKTVSKNMWASFGTTLVSSVSFFNFTSPYVPRNSNFNSLDLKTGPSVDYKLNKLLLLGVSAGLWTPVMYRQYGRWEKSNHYFFDGKVDSTPYINVNLSVIPF